MGQQYTWTKHTAEDLFYLLCICLCSPSRRPPPRSHLYSSELSKYERNSAQPVAARPTPCRPPHPHEHHDDLLPPVQGPEGDPPPVSVHYQAVGGFPHLRGLKARRSGHGTDLLHDRAQRRSGHGCGSAVPPDLPERVRRSRSVKREACEEAPRQGGRATSCAGSWSQSTASGWRCRGNRPVKAFEKAGREIRCQKRCLSDGAGMQLLAVEPNGRSQKWCVSRSSGTVTQPPVRTAFAMCRNRARKWCFLGSAELLHQKKHNPSLTGVKELHRTWAGDKQWMPSSAEVWLQGVRTAVEELNSSPEVGAPDTSRILVCC